MSLAKQFWSNKRVLITGHTGFKGSWLSLWLQSLGANVTGYALSPPTGPSLFEQINLSQGMNSIIGDIRDEQHLAKVIQEQKPEIIFHMAAQSLVRYSYENPVETYSVNVMGTVNLLEAVRKVDSVKALINITTDKCYENKEWLWAYRENEPLGGYDPYSNSKACSELVTSAYRNSFHMPVASARAGNVIGGGDWARDRIIPDIMRSCLNGERLKIRYPNAIRPWQHVLEPLSGYLLLAEKLYKEPQEYAQAWNFGPYEQDAKKVSWIADFMLKAWGQGLKWELDETPLLHEAHYLKLDSAKARAKLGWQPVWNLETALEKIIDWYHLYQDKGDLKDLMLEQIQEYSLKVSNE